MIQLLGNRVLVLPDEVKATPGGIVLPDGVGEKSATCEGTVVEVGPGEYNQYRDVTVPMSVAVGDKVIFYKYNDTHKISTSGKECLVLTEDQIYAIKSKEE